MQKYLIIAVLAFSILLPLITSIVWKKKTNSGVWPFFAGVIGFVLFAIALEQGCHFLCLIYPSKVSMAIKSNILLYALYGSFVSGIFEETGRLFVFKVFLQKRNNISSSVAYGIGHGGIEVFLTLGISYILLLVRTFFGFDFGNQMYNMQLDIAVSVLTLPMCATAVYERIIAFVFHISASVLVFKAAKEKRIGLYFLMILIHALANFPAVFAQQNLIPMMYAEIWATVVAVAVFIDAIRIYKEV